MRDQSERSSRRQLAMYSYLIQNAEKGTAGDACRNCFFLGRKTKCDKDAVYTTDDHRRRYRVSSKKDIADYDELHALRRVGQSARAMPKATVKIPNVSIAQRQRCCTLSVCHSRLDQESVLYLYEPKILLYIHSC